MIQSNYSSHSADVDLWLDCGSHGKIPLSRISPTAIVAIDRNAVFPIGPGRLVVVVDGEQTIVPVQVSPGTPSNRGSARVVVADEAAPF